MNAPVPAFTVLPQDHDRRRFIGGSDAGAIMGCGARYDGEQQTPYTVWLKKTSQVREELDPKKRKFFDRRKRWEPVIVEMLREEFDAEIVSVNNRYVDPEVPFFAAELDFEWRDPSDGSIQNGEIKTVHPFAFGETQGWGEAWTDEVPVHYAAQVMHGLGVMRRRSCILAAMVGIDEMIFYRVQRDEETIAGMREKCKRFWFDNVQGNVAPDPQTMDDLLALFKKANGRPVELSDEIFEKLEQLRAVRGALKAHKSDEETLEFEVADFVCKQWGIEPLQSEAAPQTIDNALLLRNGVQVATWKKQRGTHLDQKRLKKDKPEVIADYTKEHWFRPFRFPKS